MYEIDLTDIDILKDPSVNQVRLIEKTLSLEKVNELISLITDKQYLSIIRTSHFNIYGNIINETAPDYNGENVSFMFLGTSYGSVSFFINILVNKYTGVSTFNIRLSFGIESNETGESDYKCFVTGNGQLSLIDEIPIGINDYDATSNYLPSRSVGGGSFSILFNKMKHSMYAIPFIKLDLSQDLINRLAFNLTSIYSIPVVALEENNDLYILNNRILLNDAESENIWAYFTSFEISAFDHENVYSSTRITDEGFGESHRRQVYQMHFKKTKGANDWTMESIYTQLRDFYVSDNGFITYSYYYRDMFNPDRVISFTRSYTPSIVVEENQKLHIDTYGKDSLVFIVPNRTRIGVDLNIVVKNSIGNIITSCKRGERIIVYATPFYKVNTPSNPPDFNGRLYVSKNASVNNISLSTFFSGIGQEHAIIVHTNDLQIGDNTLALNLEGSMDYIIQGDEWTSSDGQIMYSTHRSFTFTITE